MIKRSEWIELKAGDPIFEGDEIFMNGKWHKTSEQFHTFRKTLNKSQGYILTVTKDIKMRRKRRDLSND